MPTISVFYGIIIKMFFNDHDPAHFHVEYGEFKAVVSIETFSITRGKLPRKATELVIEWAKLHQNELVKNWELCKSKHHPKKIEPLI